MPFHPSPHLNFLFGRRSYQGCDPATARFIFTGEDANYAPDIEAQPIWPFVTEYLTDGVAFWNHHGVHHPLLLGNYQGQGMVYHRHYHAIFRHEGGDSGGVKAPLPACIRQGVCFVEYLDRPTTGNNNIDNATMVRETRGRWHLGWLAQLLIRRPGDPERTVFLTKGVANKLRKDTERPYPSLVPPNPAAVVAVFPADARRHGVVIHGHVCDHITREQRRELHGVIRRVLEHGRLA